MKALETVHLSEKQGVKCKKLSGGMVRRLGIAQALLGNPQFLLYHACEAEIEDGYLFLIKGKERNGTVNNIYQLQKLHFHTQRILYFVPMALLYLILIPNQYSLLNEMDAATAVRVFNSAQEYLILTEIWLQYLGFRYLMSPELKEVSYFCCTDGRTKVAGRSSAFSYRESCR